MVTGPIRTDEGTNACLGRTFVSGKPVSEPGVLSQNFLTDLFYLPDKLSPMPLAYDRIAGQSLERLAALSDGIFAVAMTLLVLDIHVPESASVHSEHDLWRALIGLGPRLLVYLMSFLTLGIFWNGQQVQLNNFSGGDRNLTWINITFLAAVSLVPFSTALLAGFITHRLALAVYWINLAMLGAALYGSWRYAVKARLLKEQVTYEVQCAIERRIVLAQALYAFGALLCLFSTYCSIAFIILMQLNFAIAPRIPGLKRI